MPVSAVLFDLDGTLIDSAPDLAGAANELRADRGLPALPYALFRPMVGAGARGMLKVALSLEPSDPEFGELREKFLAFYAARMTRETRLFDAMRVVLNELRARECPWGIVTNKAERFTHPVVHALGLMDEAAVVISGDTTPHSKPHPAPLLEAARRMKVPPEACVYVGDDHRDILAGRAASMQTIAVAWGYLGMGVPIDQWGADHLIQAPNEILELLFMV